LRKHGKSPEKYGNDQRLFHLQLIGFRVCKKMLSLAESSRSKCHSARAHGEPEGLYDRLAPALAIELWGPPLGHGRPRKHALPTFEYSR
jgi:hypothetical protein